MAISLPLRINLISLVFASLVATVLTGLGGIFLHHQQTENAANRAHFAAEELAARAQRLLALEMRVEDFLNFEQQCAAVIQGNELLREAALLDGDGRPHYRSTPAPVAAPLPGDLVQAARTARQSSERARTQDGYVVLPILQGKERIAAYAVVAIDRDAVLRHTLQRVSWLVLSALALFAVAVLLQQYIFWRTIGRPLGHLVQTADEIQPDRLSRFPDLPTDGHEGDDIGRLYGAFSRLMQRLLEARRELVAQNEALEATVRERTAQLTQANAELAHDIRRREQLEEELRRLASTDALTGLANRAFVMGYLAKRIDHARRYRSALGVMLFDFDGFKAINDTHGHAAGDEALKAMARRLQLSCRQSDLVARLGGDEFLIVFEGCEDEAGVALLAQRVRQLFEEPIAWNGRALHLGVSIGAALFPAHGSDLNTLLAQADLAMYDVKQRGGGFALARPPQRDEAAVPAAASGLPAAQPG
ncbi:MAG: diguanylate cyclase [Burkholderiaceae bacterium]|nr:diguanylate cyclase [Burkholderiaceae bacterium]